MRRTVLLWLLLFCALTGVLLKLGVPWGRFHWHQLRYFTTLSNLLGVLYAVFALWRGRESVPATLRGSALLALLVTGVVYHLLLRGVFGGQPAFSVNWWANQLVHTAAPLLMAADWLLTRSETVLGWEQPLLWAVFPVLCVVATIAVAKTGLCFPGSGTPYPYPFLDVWALGWKPVFRNLAVMFAAFLALGYGLVGLDRLGR